MELNFIKGKVYDIGGVHVADTKNIIRQLHQEGKFAELLKVYGEMGQRVTRILDLPIDHEDYAAAKANREACTVVVNGCVVDIYADLKRMVSYEADSEGNEAARWIGILVDTGAEDITKLSYNGQAMDAADVDEAKLVGGGAGTFVLWINPDNLANKAKTLVITGDGYQTVALTVAVHDISE